MSNPYNINLVKEAFGIYGSLPVFIMGEKPVENKQSYYISEATGSLVWDRITLRNPDNNNLNWITPTGEVIIQPAYTFPDTIIIEVSQSKDIIRTKIAGANGKVKEEISLDDYQISIMGLIINYRNDDYPYVEAGRLQGVFKRPLECDVESKFLNNILKVKRLVFGDLKFKSFPGHNNVQAFEITAESDDPIVFNLIKK